MWYLCHLFLNAASSGRKRAMHDVELKENRCGRFDLSLVKKATCKLEKGGYRWST